MQVEQVNSILRGIFNDLINDGFKKSHVCGITLGGSNVPQFDSFMKGVDFGIKPLQRIIENRKFDFKITIVPKNETEISKFIEATNIESLKRIKAEMLKTLEDDDSIRAASVPKTGVIAKVSSTLFDEIVK